jgi:hypothetical protein
MSFPDITIPPETDHRSLVDKLQRFFNSARKYWININTYNDITISQSGKGIVLTNAAGTVTKRVRINDAGNGLIYEDL